MGAWGAGSFENDTALDFIDELTGISDIKAVLEADYDDEDAEMDADDACNIIAASECLAAMLGNPCDDIPDDLPARLAGFGTPDPGLVDRARKLLPQVRDSSELAELWDEADEEEAAEFRQAVNNLIARLG